MTAQRRFTRCLFVFVLGACGVGRVAAQPERPNILWLVSEDNQAYSVGAYGDPLARTPNLDRLAAEGIVFTRTHCPAPVCAPVRSTIITGVSAATLGTQHMRSTHPLPTHVDFFPRWLRDAGYYCTNNAKTDYNTSSNWSEAWDADGSHAHWRGRAPDQPFFAVFNFGQSHEGQLHQRRQLVTDPASVRVPPYLPDTPTVRADLAQAYDGVARADAAIGHVLAQLEADGLADNTIVFYCGDNGGIHPRSKRFLYRAGTHVPLITRFPSRFAKLAPRSVDGRCDELVTFVDFAPTVLALAGVDIPSHLQGRVFAGPQRAPAPDSIAAFRGRMDERTDFSRAIIDGRFRYIRNYLPHLPHGRRIDYLWQQASMVEWAALHRAGQLDQVQRAFFEPKPAEELYDDQADPDNVRNLANDPAHRHVLLRLRQANRDHLKRIRDTGFLPESLMVELAGGRSPADAAADESVYPLEQLAAFADAFQLDRGTPDDDRLSLAALLKEDRVVLRYWAVELSRGRSGEDIVVEQALRDSHPVVRLAAARLRLERDNHARHAWEVVGECLEGRYSAALRFEAAETATAQPNIPEPVMQRLRDAAMARRHKSEPGPNPDYIARLLRAWEAEYAAAAPASG